MRKRHEFALAVTIVLFAAACSDSSDPPTTTAAGATTSTTAESTSTSSSPTSTSPPPTGATTTAPAVTGAATAAEAVEAWITGAGLSYAGDCATTSMDTDVGKECSDLAEDRGDEVIYREGPTFSQFTTWMLVRRDDDGWSVVDTASADDGAPAPW